MFRRFVERFRRNERGNALVETAIVLPVAILILLGGFELARAISYVHAADKAVRDVSRYLARLPKSAGAPSNTTATNLVTSDGLLGISSADLVSANVTVDTARYAAGYISLSASITYKVWLLSVIFPNPNFTFTVAHEQPFIGE